AGDGGNRTVASRTCGWPLVYFLSHHFPLEPVVSGTSLVSELVPGRLGLLPAGEAFLAHLGHGRLHGGVNGHVRKGFFGHEASSDLATKRPHSSAHIPLVG